MLLKIFIHLPEMNEFLANFLNRLRQFWYLFIGLDLGYIYVVLFLP